MGSRFWLVGIIVGLAVAAVFRDGLLFVAGVVIGVAIGVSQLWRRFCLTNLEYRRVFSTERASFGDTVELTVEIVNRKLLPLAWVTIDDEIPRDLVPPVGRTTYSHKPSRRVLQNLVALRPYERVRRHYTLPCRARGEHIFGPVRLRSGDLFGLAWAEETRPTVDLLLVHPRIVPLEALGLPAREPLGDRRSPSWIFEDPSRTIGVRDYAPGDSPRRIHWPATARAQQLQVREYEATTTYRLCLFLNVNTHGGDGWWWMDYSPELLEQAITTTASIAGWAIERRYQVGLYANSSDRLAHGREIVPPLVAIPPSQDPGQLLRVLDALARLRTFATQSFAAVLADQAPHLPFGTTVVAVASAVGVETVAALRRLRGRGHPVVLMLIGDEAPVLSLDGVVVRRVRPSSAPEALAVPHG
ncbi:MAG: DUF58 domain-containing protein [Chloroflexi bacterium]|nr:DUF58 domain-containing protein [Chloroflexota bacterium]